MSFQADSFGFNIIAVSRGCLAPIDAALGFLKLTAFSVKDVKRMLQNLCIQN